MDPKKQLSSDASWSEMPRLRPVNSSQLAADGEPDDGGVDSG
jgi:hypothetical protein